MDSPVDREAQSSPRDNEISDPLNDLHVFPDNSPGVWLVDVCGLSCEGGKTHCIEQRRSIDNAGRESEVERKRSTEQAQKKPPARLVIDLKISKKFSHLPTVR